MKKGLLDEIAEHVKSYCLSDLHTMEYSNAIYAVAEKMDAPEYSLREWEDAVSYILEEPASDFGSQEQARQYLLARLGKTAGYN